MEEKSSDKYQEPIKNKQESSVSEEEIQTEKEKPFSNKEEILELEKKLAEKKTEAIEDEKIEKEQNKGREPAKKEEGEKESASTTPPVSAQTKETVKRLKSLDRTSQVKALCGLAFEKGLGFAIEEARRLNSPYILDEFHDKLVDEFYKKLIEENKLKRF